MADTVSVEYLYPPKLLDGAWEEHSGNRKVVVRLTGMSDGTGETDVRKIRLVDLKTPNRVTPTRTAVEWVEFQVRGMIVLLEWDRAPNALICRLNAAGSEDSNRMDWSCFGGRMDPGGDDRTGDILLTSTNADAGDSYDITLCLRLKD